MNKTAAGILSKTEAKKKQQKTTKTKKRIKIIPPSKIMPQYMHAEEDMGLFGMKF